MSPVAYVMEEVEPEAYARTEHNLALLRTMLEHAGFRVRQRGVEYCPPALVDHFRTQTSRRYSFRAAYETTVLRRLRGAPGDIIVATEPWHVDCFRGLLRGGRWRDLPVLILEDWQAGDAKETARRIQRALAELNRWPNPSLSGTHRVRETTLS